MEASHSAVKQFPVEHYEGGNINAEIRVGNEMSHVTIQFANNDKHCRVVCTKDWKEGKFNKGTWLSDLAEKKDYCKAQKLRVKQQKRRQSRQSWMQKGGRKENICGKRAGVCQNRW